ncbi:uncharacterized protein LOC116685593 [Lates japonicus]
MWTSKFYTWSALIWIFLWFCHHPVAGVFRYTAAELLWLRRHLPEPPPPVLHHHPDIAVLPRRRYIHRGSCKNFHHDNSKTIKSFWSTSHCPHRNTGRAVDHRALASLAKSANASTKHDSTTVNFGLLNIRSLRSKGHLIQDLLTDRKLDFLCLTETWQQPNDFSQLNESTPPGFVYICHPHGNGRGGDLAIIYRDEVLPVPVPGFNSFECTVFKLPGRTPTIVATVYRPPKPQ